MTARGKLVPIRWRPKPQNQVLVYSLLAGGFVVFGLFVFLVYKVYAITEMDRVAKPMNRKALADVCQVIIKSPNGRKTLDPDNKKTVMRGFYMRVVLKNLAPVTYDNYRRLMKSCEFSKEIT
ncbi:MAG: hypothetical protein EOP06_19390, partial [Proteobacteria bacterium]